MPRDKIVEVHTGVGCRKVAMMVASPLSIWMYEQPHTSSKCCFSSTMYDALRSHSRNPDPSDSICPARTLTSSPEYSVLVNTPHSASSRPCMQSIGPCHECALQRADQPRCTVVGHVSVRAVENILQLRGAGSETTLSSPQVVFTPLEGIALVPNTRTTQIADAPVHCQPINSGHPQGESFLRVAEPFRR